MKEIPLTQGKWAIVDNSLYDYINQWKWCYSAKGYAVRKVTEKGKKKIIYMHRVINQTPDNLQTDHVNRNRLDNRKCNLRNATPSQNAINVPKLNNCSSRFIGVCLQKQKRKDKIYYYWMAYISVNGKRVSLGTFKAEEEAAFAYNEAAIKYYGEFAVLNEVRFCYG